MRALEETAERAHERAGHAAASEGAGARRGAVRRRARARPPAGRRGARGEPGGRRPARGRARAVGAAARVRSCPARRDRTRPGDGRAPPRPPGRRACRCSLEAAEAVAPIDPRKALELVFHTLMAASDAGSTATQVEARPDRRVDPPARRRRRGGVPARPRPRVRCDGRGRIPSAAPGCCAETLERGTPEREARYSLWASAAALWLGDDRLTRALAQPVRRPCAAPGRVRRPRRRPSACGPSSTPRTSASTRRRSAAEEAILCAREIDAENLAGAAAQHPRRHRGDPRRRRARRRSSPARRSRIATAHGLGLRVGNADAGAGAARPGPRRWAEALDRYLQLAGATRGQRRHVHRALDRARPDRGRRPRRPPRRRRARAPRASTRWVDASRVGWAQARARLLPRAPGGRRRGRGALRGGAAARPVGPAVRPRAHPAPVRRASAPGAPPGRRPHAPAGGARGVRGLPRRALGRARARPSCGRRGETARTPRPDDARRS